MSIRSTLYGKRVWMGGNPSSEQIAGALDLLQEDCTSETFQYHIGYWRTLRSDIVAKGLRKREKVETSERQQIRCTLPGGRSNPHRAENLRKFRAEMALYRGGPSDKMTNLVYQTGKLISGGPTTPLARKQELRQLMQAEELNLENFARYNELYSEFKDRIPDS